MSKTYNIDILGYGKIYKSVMRDQTLPILAKAIYAYFCCYAGSGTKAFPKRDKTIRDLQMNKDTYTKHLKTLVDKGYIGKERTATGNLYTIIQSTTAPAMFLQVPDSNIDQRALESVVAKGFGTVPKVVMLDSRLTAQAKAIYAYFASFTGAGTTAFPRRTTIVRDLCLSTSGYYPHFKLLTDYGYISMEQNRKAQGKYGVVVYQLSDMVELPEDLKALIKQPPIPMSENPNSGQSSQAPLALSPKPMSGKPKSRETARRNFGQASIKNKNKTNSVLEKKQGYHHQDAFDAGDHTPVFLLPIDQVKAAMDFEKLKGESTGWGISSSLQAKFPPRRKKNGISAQWIWR